ncbi:aldo/keto reductase [Eubacteriaceae bacterium ES2]|nr:aldo/keto reductase [Eubacteriaceae bacterium ES2]
MEYTTLNNGIKIPVLGYRLDQMVDSETEQCVQAAISVGYRLIETAQVFNNEEIVGQVMEKCGVPREEFFITLKLSISNSGYKKTKASIIKSLEKFKTEYFDLVLMDQSINDFYVTYCAMEEAYKAGYIRAIGLANFNSDCFIDLCQIVEITPAVNQLETHVYHQQKSTHEMMKRFEVQHEAWAPFAAGRKSFFTNHDLIKLGKKYGKSVAQVALRFLIQNDIVVSSKSKQKIRMIENFNVFDFTLNNKDIEVIYELDENESLCCTHYGPATVSTPTGAEKI